MVNSAFLKMLAMENDPHDISVELTSSSYPSLRKALPGDTPVRFRKLKVTDGTGRLSLSTRYLQSAFHNIIALARSKKGDTLLYNFNNLFSTSIINLLARKLYKGRKIFIVCHGEMEYLATTKRDSRAYKRILKRLAVNFFTHTSKSRLAPDLRFIVLGDNIRQALPKYVPDYMAERFSSIDHPIIPYGISLPIRRKSNDKIHIGTVGILNRDKGAEAYIRLLQRLGDNQRLEFSVAGQLQEDIEIFRSLPVHLTDYHAGPIPAHHFQELVSELDYILLLYPSDSYKLIASGAVLDCIRFRKPLIAITNPYFRYLFERFGSLGILVSDEDELAEVISDIALGRRQVPDTLPAIERALTALSTDTLAPQLSEIIRKAETV